MLLSVALATSARCCCFRRAVAFRLYARPGLDLGRISSGRLVEAAYEYSHGTTSRRQKYSSANTKVPTPQGQKRKGDVSKNQSLPGEPASEDTGMNVIRKAVEVAIYGILHRNEELKSLEALAKMNGYQQVGIDGPYRRVQLAEGVIAEANKRLDKEITVFVRPARRRESSKGHPPFLEKDFTLYRILEQRVEDRFNQLENRVKEWYEGKVNTVHRARKVVIDRAYTPVVSRLSSMRRRSAQSPAQFGNVGNGGVEVEDKKEKDDEATGVIARTIYEDILVLSNKDGRAVLVEDVPREYRLLALPTESSAVYSLRHGRSATVIYSGLVLFGAVPLTYRSLKYAMDYAEYPAIANAMIASVALSVSYSLWASRASARTRQSLVVSSAVSSRTVARDDAVHVQLLDEACRALTDTVIHEYISRLGIKQGDATVEREHSSLDIPSQNTPLQLDPIGIALNLGLLKQRASTSRDDMVAVDITTASSELEMHCKHTSKP